MKFIFWTIFIWILSIVVFIQCKTNTYACNEYNTIYIDSIKEATIDSMHKFYAKEFNRLNIENNVLNKIIIEADSVIAANDEELINANYKLERIKYYNNIAAKGNNIKFLRGWINRVLNN